MSNAWEAVRRRCGVIVDTRRAILRIIGTDQLTFLQGMLSNDVASLTAGRGTGAALLTQQGKLVSDLRVYALDSEVWLDTPGDRALAVREALERFIIADDVEFSDAASTQPLVSVEGPQAVRIALAVFGEALDDLPLHAHRACAFERQEVRVVGTTHTGERGFLVIGPPALAMPLRERCLAAGAEVVDADTLNVLRIEAGIPWFGYDMDESTLVSEVGLTEAISFTKGCYLGQEVVERIAARGQVQKKLVGLICDTPAIPAPGSKLQADTQDVGWITSAVRSPQLDSVIALAYVRRDHWVAGTILEVSSGGGARVAELPFVPRHR